MSTDQAVASLRRKPNFSSQKIRLRIPPRRCPRPQRRHTASPCLLQRQLVGRPIPDLRFSLHRRHQAAHRVRRGPQRSRLRPEHGAPRRGVRVDETVEINARADVARVRRSPRLGQPRWKGFCRRVALAAGSRARQRDAVHDAAVSGCEGRSKALDSLPQQTSSHAVGLCRPALKIDSGKMQKNLRG